MKTKYSKISNFSLKNSKERKIIVLFNKEVNSLKVMAISKNKCDNLAQ